MPVMIGPSHGTSGPSATLLVKDDGKRYVRLARLRVVKPDDAYDLGFSGQEVTTQEEGTTLLQLRNVRPERRNMSVDDLATDVGNAMAGKPGYAIHMDTISLLYQLPVPDVAIARFVIEQGPGGSPATFEPTDPADTHPIERFSEPHSCTDYWVRKAMRDLIADAVRTYLDLPNTNGWTIQEFIAGYLMEHGAWLDLNYSEKDVRPVSEWLYP